MLFIASTALVEMGYKPNDFTDRFTSKDNVIFFEMDEREVAHDER